MPMWTCSHQEAGKENFRKGFGRTSSIIKGENDFDKNELRLFTKSGSCYHLAYAEIERFSVT